MKRTQSNDSAGYQNPAPLQEAPYSEGDIAHNTDEDPREVGQKIATPEGYESIEAFLKEMRDDFSADLDADKDNREEGIKDAEFVAVDQWDPDVRAEREAAGRPCITINTMPQFIGQVVGDRRMNKTAIRLIPKESSDVELAEIRGGIIKSIEEQSKAERVYDAALEDQVTCGIGNFRVVMDWSSDDAFDQDIFIRQIPNPFSVVWDRLSVDPTGKDARRCWVQDILPRTVYEKRWPGKAIPSDLGELANGDTGLYGRGWVSSDDVRVTEYWRLLKRPAKIMLMQDGSIKKWNATMNMDEVQLDLQGQPVMRDTTESYACMYLVTGFDILEGPYELPITRLPIIRVNGREVRVGEKRVRFGLVRWARDPARMRNYWRSVAVETLAMAPKNQWLAQAKSVKGREDDFREAHLTNDPLLIYNDNTDAPKRENGPQMPSAVLQEAQMNVQDIKDTTGLQDASLGMRSNEVSGKAIMARQREGDVATVIYHDNLSSAIEEAGSVVNQLIPVCYDTIRTLRTIGQDEKAKLVKVNDPNDPESIDLAKGKFDVAIITGPSYTTQRMFAAEAMMEAMKVAPQLFQVAGDLLVEAQDWPGAHGIAERLKKAMPPELTKDPDAPPTQEELIAKTMEDEKQKVAIAAAEEEAEFKQKERELAIAERTKLVQKLDHEVRKADAEADKAETEAERAELELNAATVEIPARVMATGGRPQPSSDASGNAAANSGSQPGRQSRRPKRKNK